MDFEKNSVPWLLKTYGAKTIIAILTRVIYELYLLINFIF